MLHMLHFALQRNVVIRLPCTIFLIFFLVVDLIISKREIIKIIVCYVKIPFTSCKPQTVV